VTPGEFRLRVVYGKTGRLRHLSHLEIVHALERMVRRARLPFAVTQGFNPHLKAAFGPALPVGTAGEKEYFDVWLTRYTAAEEVLRMLRARAPGDLSPIEARYVADNAPSLTAALTIASYEVELDGEELDASKVQAALSEVLSAGEFTIVHKGKHKVFDLARSVPKDARVEARDGGVSIDLTVRMGPQGSLRPEALIRHSLEVAGIEASAVRTTRHDTFVESDEGVWSRPV
jgi:radical SAM-linked protein